LIGDRGLEKVYTFALGGLLFWKLKEGYKGKEIQGKVKEGGADPDLGLGKKATS